MSLISTLIRREDEDTVNRFFHYNPSKVAPIIFITAFALVLLVLIIDVSVFLWTERSKRFKFETVLESNYDKREMAAVIKANRKRCYTPMIPIGLGLLFECVGYGTRAKLISQGGKSIFKYSLMEVFCLCAPSLMSGGIFMIFHRIQVSLHAEDHSLVPTKRLTVFFVVGDVVSFVVQAGGSSLMVMEKMRTAGSYIAIVGFALQIFFFSSYLFVSTKFLQSMKKQPTDTSRAMDSNNLNTFYYRWKKLIILLGVAMIIILLRCILRLVQFAQGFDGVMNSSEAAYYITDPFLIFWSAVVLVSLRTPYRLWDMKSYQIYDEMFNTPKAYDHGSLGGDVIQQFDIGYGESKRDIL